MDEIRKPAASYAGCRGCDARYARHFGEDEEKWGITACCRFDYERHPDMTQRRAPVHGLALLRERGNVDDDIIDAIARTHPSARRDGPNRHWHARWSRWTS